MEENSLQHHGVKGQVHGVRNGPPYPLYRQERFRNRANAAIKKKLGASKVTANDSKMKNKEIAYSKSPWAIINKPKSVNKAEDKNSSDYWRKKDKHQKHLNKLEDYRTTYRHKYDQSLKRELYVLKKIGKNKKGILKNVAINKVEKDRAVNKIRYELAEKRVKQTINELKKGGYGVRESGRSERTLKDKRNQLLAGAGMGATALLLGLSFSGAPGVNALAGLGLAGNSYLAGKYQRDIIQNRRGKRKYQITDRNK